MSYIGTPPSNAFTSLLKQDFSTSATTGYTLDHAVNNANDIALFINFVRQEPTAGYAASGTTLTLTSATASSDDMYCVYLGQALQTVNPPNASVGTSQLVDGAVTYAKASGFGKVLQVVQTTTTSDLSNNTTSYVASGFTAALTPSATSSKILIQLSGGSMDYDAATLDVFCALYTDTGGGGYSATTSFTKTRQGSGFGMPNCQTLLLSPNTTSAVTVQPYVKSSTTNRAYINRNSALLTLTLTEIGG